MPFKNFFYGNTGGKVDLAASDLQLPQFKFFTVDRGDITISSDFTVDPPSGTTTDGNPLSFHLSETAIESVRPTLESWVIEEGQVSWSNTNGYFGFNGPGQFLTDVKTEIESFGKIGTGAFCQLIKANRHLRGFNYQGILTDLYKTPYNNQWACDTGLPYSPVQPNYPSTWEVSSIGRNSDSPQQPTFQNGFNLILSEAQDDFKTWVIYRPPSAQNSPTTWIPLSKYEWGWAGTASRSIPSENWNFTPGQTYYGEPLDTKEFPAWVGISPGQFGFQ